MSTVMEPQRKGKSKATARQVFHEMRQALNSALIEREEEIDLILTALVARQHVLFVGPPGVAKSMLADAVVQWTGGKKFSIQINKFTTPEELLGPISIKGLKEDKLHRVTTNRLPEAHVAFLDEAMKGSSAILNAMLRILNERTFDNAGTLVRCPLQLAVAASNEWPSSETGKELSALFDRFLFRKEVRPIATDEGMRSLLWEADLTPKVGKISQAQMTEACNEADALPWDSTAQDHLLEIIKSLRNEGISPGCRRLRQSVGAVQAFAWVQGDHCVTDDHLEVLCDTLWEDPTEQPKVVRKLITKIASPPGLKVNSLLTEARQIAAAVSPRDMKSCVTATKKLGEIAKKLSKVGTERADQGQAWVINKIKELKGATIEALE